MVSAVKGSRLGESGQCWLSTFPPRNLVCWFCTAEGSGAKAFSGTVSRVSRVGCMGKSGSTLLCPKSHPIHWRCSYLRNEAPKRPFISYRGFGIRRERRQAVAKQLCPRKLLGRVPHRPQNDHSSYFYSSSCYRGVLSNVTVRVLYRASRPHQ